VAEAGQRGQEEAVGNLFAPDGDGGFYDVWYDACRFYGRDLMLLRFCKNAFLRATACQKQASGGQGIHPLDPRLREPPSLLVPRGEGASAKICMKKQPRSVWQTQLIQLAIGQAIVGRALA
jgi:hypothetical protein